MNIWERSQSILGRVKAPVHQSALVKFAPYVVAGFVGFVTADLVLLSYRPAMLPNEAPPVRPARPNLSQFTPLNEYAVVWDRNLLNEDGQMPPALSSGAEGPSIEQEAVLSQLPLTLLGTIVHFNADRSIATIQKSGDVTQSYIPGEEIQGMAKITKIERKRVTFQNLNNRRLEYIEIPDDVAFGFDVQKKGQKASGPIQKTGQNDFVVQRSEVERLTSNLSEVLQQARMEPRFGPDGNVNGFCFVSIQPSTIYETLGFRIGDCIESVNGAPINTPQQAMGLYQELREARSIRLGIERDSRSETFNYSIQ